MAAPKEILDLVAEYESDQSFYKSSQFNETELRTRFINPLIAALGWDVYHDQPGRADQHEVKEEDSVEVEATDRQIDALVYELYALTKEEIGIVEEGG